MAWVPLEIRKRRKTKILGLTSCTRVQPSILQCEPWSKQWKILEAWQRCSNVTGLAYKNKKKGKSPIFPPFSLLSHFLYLLSLNSSLLGIFTILSPSYITFLPYPTLITYVHSLFTDWNLCLASQRKLWEALWGDLDFPPHSSLFFGT